MIQYISNFGRRAAHGVERELARFRQHLRRLKQQLARDLPQHLLTVIAVVALVFSMGGTWTLAADASAAPSHPAAGVAATTVDRPAPTTSTRGEAPATSTAGPPAGSRFAPKKEVTGKLNLNTATAEQLMLLPSIGPAKAERVVTWRKKTGGFKRTADLRRVKGFGYKTFKRLEPFLDITGDTTLAIKR